MGPGPMGSMPGLPKVPAANNIDVDEDGRITGLPKVSAANSIDVDEDGRITGLF